MSQRLVWWIVPLFFGLAVPLQAAAATRHPVELKGVLNLNTATVAELRVLPGVGAKKAERVIQQREKHKFASTDQLMKVKGFGRLTYRKLKPYLAVSGNTTLTRVGAPARTRATSAPPASEEVAPSLAAPPHDG